MFNRKPENRSYSKKEMRELYDMSHPTFMKMVKPILERFKVPKNARILTIIVCQAIFSEHGSPFL